MVRCNNCPWKAGLVDERTVCPACSGTGQAPVAVKKTESKPQKKVKK